MQRSSIPARKPRGRGLGLYPGVVRRFPIGRRAFPTWANQLEPDGRYVYFAHSYYVPENQ